MEHVKKLHDLGFRNKSRKKKRSKKNNGKKPPIQPPTSTTLEGLLNRFHNMQINPPPDAPPDTDISPGGDSDAIKKGDEGFETWVGPASWKEGYSK